VVNNAVEKVWGSCTSLSNATVDVKPLREFPVYADAALRVSVELFEQPIACAKNYSGQIHIKKINVEKQPKSSGKVQPLELISAASTLIYTHATRISYRDDKPRDHHQSELPVHKSFLHNFSDLNQCCRHGGLLWA